MQSRRCPGDILPNADAHAYAYTVGVGYVLRAMSGAHMRSHRGHWLGGGVGVCVCVPKVPSCLLSANFYIVIVFMRMYVCV